VGEGAIGRENVPESRLKGKDRDDQDFFIDRDKKRESKEEEGGKGGGARGGKGPASSKGKKEMGFHFTFHRESQKYRRGIKRGLRHWSFTCKRDSLHKDV